MAELVVTTTESADAQFLDVTTSPVMGEQFLDFIIPPGAVQDIVVKQTAHGFVVGNVLRFNGTLYVLAQADNAADAEVAGIVSTLAGPDIFFLHSFGPMNITGPMIPGDVYFLSDVFPGQLSLTEPSSVGTVSKPLFIATAPTAGLFFNFRGMVISAGSVIPTGANPTATIGLTAVNGIQNTFMRSDAAPALSQAIAPTWSANHIFNSSLQFDLVATAPPALTGNVNDYNPTNLSNTIILNVSGGAADRTITGLAGGAGGRILTITNVGATNRIILSNQNASSLAANRFLFPQDVTLDPNTSLAIRYDSSVNFWRPWSRALANTGVTAGTYGDASDIPVVTVDITGRITAASTVTGGALTDVGTDGIVITGGTGAVLGAGTSLAQTKSDASHNGYLSSADWTTFNAKQAALSFGNLTDAGTDGIVITGGTGAVIGAGTSLAQTKADASHNGYLSSTDWTTFNNAATGSGVVSFNTRNGAVVSVSGDYTQSMVGFPAPSAGQIPVGNAGGTLYAAATLSGSGATMSLASTGVLTISAIANASLSNSSITIGGTSTALGGSVLGNVTNDTQTKAAIVPNTAPSAGQILVGNAGGTAYAPQTLTGATLSSAGALSAVANATLATMTANSIKANATGSSATPTDVGAAVARTSSVLNIDQETGHGDSTYNILATDRIVFTNANFSAARTWNLPQANTTNAGQTLRIVDSQGTLTATNTLSIARSGSDTINGATSSTVLTQAHQAITYVSDGSSNWTTLNSSSPVDLQVFTATGPGTWTKPTWFAVSLVHVRAVGPGGGGGQGGSNTGAAFRMGGAGGGGGACVDRTFLASELGTSESVSVGAGGLGGTTGGSGAIGQDGAASATSGSITSFGTNLIVKAGGGGGGRGGAITGAAGSGGGGGGMAPGSTGGTAAAGGGGPKSSGTGSGSGVSGCDSSITGVAGAAEYGGGGGGGHTAVPANFNGCVSFYGGGGGGCGSGSTATPGIITGTAGGNINSTTLNGGGGGGVGTDGASPTKGTDGSGGNSTKCGTGGGGGGGTITANTTGGAGGLGGTPGGGGGGGGCGTNTGPGGAGGNGGDGRIWVWSW